MNTRFNNTAGHPSNRRGITLLEVLIAIGILAIGLTSVVALVPAGKSQAARAIVLDRASVLAANALADAATFGLLRVDVSGNSLAGYGMVPQSAPSTKTLLDPTYSGGSALSADSYAALTRKGIYSSPADGLSPATAPAPVLRLLAQSRDDLIVSPGATEDDLPFNSFVDGARAFTGRMTCFYWIKNQSTLSVVVFHNRDPNLQEVAGTIDNSTLTLRLTGALGDRTLKDVVKPGVVLYANGRFHQALAATVDSSNTFAYVTLSTGLAILGFPPNCPIVLYPDSVGYAEKTFKAETPGPYTQ